MLATNIYLYITRVLVRASVYLYRRSDSEQLPEQYERITTPSALCLHTREQVKPHISESAETIRTKPRNQITPRQLYVEFRSAACMSGP